MPSGVEFSFSICMWTCDLISLGLLLGRTSPTYHCLHSAISSSLLCPWLCLHWLAPRDSKKQVKFKLEFFPWKNPVKRNKVILICLVTAIFGLQWMNPLLAVLLATQAVRNRLIQWAFFSHDIQCFLCLTCLHGNIWINPIKKEKLLLFTPTLLTRCANSSWLWLPAGHPFLFIDLPSVMWVPSGPNPGFT